MINLINFINFLYKILLIKMFTILIKLDILLGNIDYNQ
jgi:hypothetical protein